MKVENVSTLKIHKLTKAQYDRELEAGRIDESAVYIQDITIDDVLSDDSTNPVQNKVIKAALDTLSSSGVVVDSTLSTESTNPVQNKVITSKVNEITESLETIKNKPVVQSDWDQNDESCTDYVKNRPIYKNDKIYFFKDLDTGNSISVDNDYYYYDENVIFYKNPFFSGLALIDDFCNTKNADNKTIYLVVNNEYLITGWKDAASLRYTYNGHAVQWDTAFDNRYLPIPKSIVDEMHNGSSNNSLTVSLYYIDEDNPQVIIETPYAKALQSDWNETDNTHSKYVENKPIYLGPGYETIWYGKAEEVPFYSIPGVGAVYIESENKQVNYTDGKAYIVMLGNKVLEGIGTVLTSADISENGLIGSAYGDSIHVKYMYNNHPHWCGKSEYTKPEGFENVEIKIQQISENILVPKVEEDYLPAFQSDWNIEDETNPSFIKNKEQVATKEYVDEKVTNIVDSTSGALDTLNTHINNKNNPHEVTLEQLGYTVATDEEINEMLISVGLIEVSLSPRLLDSQDNVLVDSQGNILVLNEDTE